MSAVSSTGRVGTDPPPDLFLPTHFYCLIVMMMVSMMMLSMTMLSMMMLSTMIPLKPMMNMMNDGDCKNDALQPNFDENVNDGTPRWESSKIAQRRNEIHFASRMNVNLQRC